jgi:tetraacyldisaccharide 4'-kinase
MNFFKPKFWDKNKISFFSILLYPISLIIKISIFLKYSFTKNHQCSIPIICIGNIYLGGTGKTPLCIELFSILKNLNMRPVFIRKKYKFIQDEINLQKKIGPVYLDKKRIKAIEEAAKNKFNIAILDDGFQDFSINKNLSIVCFNEKQLIGNGLVVPAGPLREEISALKRANIAVINGKQNINFEEVIINNNKNIKIFYTKYVAQNLDSFTNTKVIAFAGIGNPDNFFDLLVENNINIIKQVKFPDHYIYSDRELKNLISLTEKNNAVLLTTEKDYSRINDDYRKKISFLKIKLKIEKHKDFVEEIKKII